MPDRDREPDESAAWVETHRELAEHVLATFMESGDWPQRARVQRQLDRAGVRDDVDQAMASLPRLSKEARLGGDMQLRLPLHVVRHIPSAGPLIAACFPLIRAAVDLYLSDEEVPTLTSNELDLTPVYALKGTEPSPDEASRLAERAVELIRSSHPHPIGSGHRSGYTWEYEIDGVVARELVGVKDIDDYVDRQRRILREGEERMQPFLASAAQQPLYGPILTDQSREPMAEEKKLFLSHGTADKPLADLLRDTLVIGGIPERHIFYSADRATGIPAGRDVGTHLKESLLEASLVIELISRDFLQRPMCLMELGGAWVLGVSTYPIVVPPLSREEAVSQVGNVQMGALATPGQIDDVFNELHDRLSATVGIQTTVSTWNRAVASFKRQLQSILATSEATGELTPPTRQAAASAARETKEKISFANISIVDGTFGKQLIAEATNNDSAEHSASVKATFYDGSNKIVGARDGVINQLGPGLMKTLTIDSVPDHATCRLQVDTLI